MSRTRKARTATAVVLVLILISACKQSYGSGKTAEAGGPGVEDRRMGRSVLPDRTPTRVRTEFGLADGGTMVFDDEVESLKPDAGGKARRK